MSIKAILFDLDGTLLPMDQEIFTKAYFKALATKLASHGYESEALVDAIWAGTAAMVKNNGETNNEEVFWKVFLNIYGANAIGDKVYFDEFYNLDFQNIKQSCGYNPKAAATVNEIKKMGFRVALATNPIFPAIATESRTLWAGLKPEDFELYTTYENIGFCKPNIKYYVEILKRLNVAPEECLMVGNDVKEDMVAKELGMNVFLLTDCIINKNNEDISVYPNGNFDDLLTYVKQLAK